MQTDDWANNWAGRLGKRLIYIGGATCIGFCILALVLLPVMLLFRLQNYLQLTAVAILSGMGMTVGGLLMTVLGDIMEEW